MKRDDELNAGLLLLHIDGAAADVLRSHADHVSAPLAGEKQEGQRQPRARSDRVTLLEPSDLSSVQE